MTRMRDIVRVAAMADLHCTKTSAGTFQSVLAKVAESADVLVLCGDLTDYGLAEEARVLANELSIAKLPKIAVLGNHDFESGASGEVVQILTDAGVRVLDGTACEVEGVGFAGAKGFAGGFGARSLQAWGEEPVKAFVRASVEETLKLESALARLRTPNRVVLLHYAPVAATVEGEPLEIYPFLGSSRLEEPINRFSATVVFHGHAHRGHPEGVTSNAVPVHNVAMPLLKRQFPEQPPFKLVEIAMAPVAAGDGVPAEARSS